MSMVRCSDCGAAFSSHRSTCPECGAVRNKGGSRLKSGGSGNTARVIITILLAVAIVVCAVVLITMIINKDSDPDGSGVTPPVSDSGEPLTQRPVVDPPSPSDTGPSDPGASGTDEDPDEPTDPVNNGVTVESIKLNVQFDSSAGVYDASLDVGETFNFVATTVPAGAAVTWVCEDSSIATIDSDGKMIAMGSGTTKLIVSSGGMSVECIIRVR